MLGWRSLSADRLGSSTFANLLETNVAASCRRLFFHDCLGTKGRSRRSASWQLHCNILQQCGVAKVCFVQTCHGHDTVSAEVRKETLRVLSSDGVRVPHLEKPESTKSQKNEVRSDAECKVRSICGDVHVPRADLDQAMAAKQKNRKKEPERVQSRLARCFCLRRFCR